MYARGVRTVIFGGRPQPGPMQSIGGIKGSQELGLDDINSFTQLAQSLLANSTEQILTADELTLFNKTAPIPLSDFPLVIGQSSINFRNAFGPANDQIPTQFIYEAAECRLFYTPASVVKPEAYWAAAANAIWGTGTCVNSVSQSGPTPASTGIVD